MKSIVLKFILSGILLASALNPAMAHEGKHKFGITGEISCHNNCVKDLGPVADRVCFLTGVKGAFNGGAEVAKIKVTKYNWELETKSGGSPTWASARCMLF